jgi:putative transcriptional regulator
MIRIHLSGLLGERRIKRSELSRMTGISENALLHLYHENVDHMRFVTLSKICAALNCRVGDLLEYIPD